MSDEAQTRVLRYAPIGFRLGETVIATMSCIVVAVLVGNLPSPWQVASLVALLVALVYFVRRAWRLQLRVTPKGVAIDNYWRSRRLGWDEISDVGVGAETVGFLPQPAFAFQIKDGSVHNAQATPRGREHQKELIAAMEALAPPSVRFHCPK